MDDNGYVYVALSDSGIIKKFDGDGLYLCQIGGFGEDIGKLALSEKLWVNRTD